MTALSNTLLQALHQDRLVSVVTVLSGSLIGSKLLVWPNGLTEGTLGDPNLDHAAVIQALEQLKQLESSRFTAQHGDEMLDLFIEVFPPLPKLIINGAVHMAIPLVSLAKVMGFHVIVIDARRAFATRERFPQADELIVDWPSDALRKLSLDEGTYFVTLTHDDKLDMPALEVVLSAPVRYIGALGSPKTHANRVIQLKELGITDEQITRIHAPVGLKLGAKGVEEIALSILAEMIAVRHGVEKVIA